MQFGNSPHPQRCLFREESSHSRSPLIYSSCTSTLRDSALVPTCEAPLDFQDPSETTHLFILISARSKLSRAGHIELGRTPCTQDWVVEPQSPGPLAERQKVFCRVRAGKTPSTLVKTLLKVALDTLGQVASSHVKEFQKASS